MTAHWGIEDPAAAEGSELEKQAAFVTAFRYLKNRIDTFVNLPLQEHRQAVARHQAARDRPLRRRDIRPRRRGVTMSIFERYLTLWVALCIVVGVALGHVLPGFFGSHRRR